MSSDIVLRANRHAALGDPLRLGIVDALMNSDRSPQELLHVAHVPSNLLAHHLDVLERAGIITRSRSNGDRRRRYLHLDRDIVGQLAAATPLPAQPALFVCTQNSARSQLAAVLWTQLTSEPAESAGTHPAARVHPGALVAADRRHLDLRGASPRHLDDVNVLPELVITVCDRAHEELQPGRAWLHWSVPDPVESRRRSAFDDTIDDLTRRIAFLVAA